MKIVDIYDAVLFESGADTIRAAIVECLSVGIPPRGAYPCGAYPCGAYPCGADICGADICGADIA